MRFQRGHLYKDGPWWRVRWWAWMRDGESRRRVRRSAIIGPAAGPGALSKKEAARLAWDNVLAHVNAGGRVVGSSMTVAQYVQQKFVPEVIPFLKRSGRDHYGYCIKKIEAGLGDVPLYQLKVEDLQGLIANLVGGGFSPQTITHIRNAVHAILEHAKAGGYFQGENPASLVRVPEMVRRERFAMTWEQAAQVMARLSSPIREMALLSMTLTLNVAELCGLAWKHVNLGHEFASVDGIALPPRSLVVLRNYYRGTFEASAKTKARRRVQPLPAIAAQALANWREMSAFNRPDDPVFSSRNGTPVDSHNIASRVLRKVGNEVGVPLSWHVFRHTAATFAEAVGMPRSDRIALMGHATGAMTDLYTHSDIERRAGYVEQMAQRLLPAPVERVQ